MIRLRAKTPCPVQIRAPSVAVDAGAVPAVSAFEVADAAFAAGAPFDGAAERFSVIFAASRLKGFAFAGDHHVRDAQVGELPVDVGFAVAAVGGNGPWRAPGVVLTRWNTGPVAARRVDCPVPQCDPRRCQNCTSPRAGATPDEPPSATAGQRARSYTSPRAPSPQSDSNRPLAIALVLAGKSCFLTMAFVIDASTHRTPMRFDIVDGAD